MSIWDSPGRRRAVARKVAPYVWAMVGSVIFVVVTRMLWSAYATHAIRMPLRRHARMVVMEQEPGFFWAAVVVYALIAICAPVMVISQISDIRFRARHRK